MEKKNLDTKVVKKITLYIVMTIIIFSFSLLFMPHEFFLVTALIVLLFLNAVEKELREYNIKPKQARQTHSVQKQPFSRFDNSRTSKLLQ